MHGLTASSEALQACTQIVRLDAEDASVDLPGAAHDLPGEIAVECSHGIEAIVVHKQAKLGADTGDMCLWDKRAERPFGVLRKMSFVSPIPKPWMPLCRRATLGSAAFAPRPSVIFRTDLVFMGPTGSGR